MSQLNAFLARLVDSLLYPFRDQSPLVGLAVVSLLSAWAMLGVTRVASDRNRLDNIKQAIDACWFEIRLFNHDVPAMWRALAELSRHQAAYLTGLALPALLMTVCLGPVVAQLDAHYAYAGLDVGQHAVLTARIRANSGIVDHDANPHAMLTAPPGLRVETPAVWAPSLREAAWRIAATAPGDYDVVVQLGTHTATKRVRASAGIVRRSPVRPDAGIVQQMLHPAELPLPEDGPIDRLELKYPRRDVNVLGHGIHWALVFVPLTMMFTAVLRRSGLVAG